MDTCFLTKIQIPWKLLLKTKFSFPFEEKNEKKKKKKKKNIFFFILKNY